MAKRIFQRKISEITVDQRPLLWISDGNYGILLFYGVHAPSVPVLLLHIHVHAAFYVLDIFFLRWVQPALYFLVTVGDGRSWIFAWKGDTFVQGFSSHCRRERGTPTTSNALRHMQNIEAHKVKALHGNEQMRRSIRPLFALGEQANRAAKLFVLPWISGINSI